MVLDHMRKGGPHAKSVPGPEKVNETDGPGGPGDLGQNEKGMPPTNEEIL
jgi:hypothetical protein